MVFKRIFLEACVLVSFGTLVGLMLNHQLVMDALSGNLAPQREVGEDQAISMLPMPALLEEAQMASSEGALIVDARSPEMYAEGHITGAVTLPLVDIDAALPDFLARIPREKTIIAYCSGFGCPDSFDLGIILLEQGYKDVRVFEGGYPEWRDAGLPVTEGER